MPKMKTKSGAAKRFRVHGSGGIKRSRAILRHILTKKSTKRKRHLRGTTAGESVRTSAPSRRCCPTPKETRPCQESNVV